MKITNKYQMFSGPEGMTGKDQIQVRAREIDFVSSFADNLQSLLDVMSITRLIKKENGSILKTKKVAGTLETDHVDEGDVIPYSQYRVIETPMAPITIEKYAKAVSVEAIAEKGYAAAVADTDKEFKVDLRDQIIDALYAGLLSGTLTSDEDTFQMSIAMAIGKVKNKFKTMRKTATGIAVWVNTIDLYKYLGAADISLQSAFGLDYVKNFMGADVMFVSSDIPAGKVVATPLNNLVGYYVDPGDSEFAAAGLSYTTDMETGMIGFHAEGNYQRALSEAFALMGIRVFAEYIDGIAVINFGEEPAPSGEKKITAFEIDDVEGTIDEGLKTISVVMPEGTDVTELTPEITVSEGATVNPASGVEQDFTNPVQYTVTAEDETTAVYTVTVTVEV